MLIFDARTARALATILLFALAIFFIGLAWRTLLTFLFAIMFAYLFEPLVVVIEEYLHLGRGWAVALLYLVLVVAIGVFLFFVGPQIVQQAGRLTNLVPEISQRIASGKIVGQVGAQRGWSYETQRKIEQVLIQHRDQIAAWEQELLSDLGRLASNSWWLALIPIIAIFFLMSRGRFTEALVEQVARRRERALLAGLLQDIHDVLANYIRAQILLTALATAVYLGGFTLMRVPYAIALGVVAGLLEFIPMVGPLLGAAIVLGTAFFADYRLIVFLAFFLGAWRVLQDYYNSPHIMGGQVQLHPLAVLFGVLAGAEVAGVIGVYLSVPIMAILRVLWVRWRSIRTDRLLLSPGEGPSPGEPPPITPPA